jgi:hypothetical protein
MKHLIVILFFACGLATAQVKPPAIGPPCTATRTVGCTQQVAADGTQYPAGGSGSGVPYTGATGNLDMGAHTVTASGFISTPDGVHAGIVSVPGNTTVPSIPANSFGFIGPNSASLTSYVFQPTAAAPGASTVFLAGAPSSGVSALSYGKVTSAYVDNSVAVTGADINTSNQVTATHLTSALPVAQGGTALTTLTAHALYAGNATTAPTAIGPDASTTKALFSAGASADPAFRGITLPDLAAQAANTIVMNATSDSAAPTAVAMPTCTTGAVLYNTSAHAWSCVSTGGGVAQLNFNSPISLGASAVYVPIGGVTANTAARGAQLVGFSGTASTLYCRITDAGTGGQTSTFTVFHGTGSGTTPTSTTMACTTAANGSTCTDSAHSFAFSAGDTFTLSGVESSTTNATFISCAVYVTGAN